MKELRCCCFFANNFKTLMFYPVLFQTARALKLKNLPECDGLCGGASVEHMAQKGDPYAFNVTTIMPTRPDCSFSFAGVREKYRKIIIEEEEKHGKFFEMCNYKQEDTITL